MSLLRRQLLLAGIVFVLFGGIGNARENETEDADKDDSIIPKDRIAAVHRMYSRLPSTILGLKEPIRLKDTSMYFDGGTRYVTLIDANGKEFNASIGILAKEGTSERDVRRYKYLHSHVYIGAKHWQGPGSTKVAIRGPEESALYAVLIRIDDLLKKTGEAPHPSFEGTMKAMDLRYCYRNETWKAVGSKN